MGLVEPALEQREVRAAGGGHPQLCGLAERRGLFGDDVELSLGLDDPPEFHVRDHAVETSRCRPLVVVDLLGERDDFVGDGEPLLGGLGPHQCAVVAVERVSECGRIAQSSGDPDGLRAERGSTVSRGVVSKRTGQAGHHANAQRGGFGWKRLKR